MLSKMMFVMAAAATASAGTTNEGYWVPKDPSCGPKSPFIEKDGDKPVLLPTCVGSHYAEEGGASVCVKSETQKCWIEGCGDQGGLQKCDEREKDTAKAAGGLVGHELNPDPSAPSSSMRSTKLFNGMRGWKDVKDARFYDFPETLVGRDALVPSVRTEANYDMILECVTGYGGVHALCDHYVFMYSCPPCEFADGGNLPAKLLADGWAPNRCQTYFDLDYTVDSAFHNIVIYHKQTQEGYEDSIQGTELLEFVFYANTPATSRCSAHEDEYACNANIPNECAWKDGSCVSDLCPKPFKQRGPWEPKPKCQVCPFDPSEARFIPAIKV